MKNKLKKDRGTFIRLSNVEMSMIKELKERYHINISSMIREAICKSYRKMSSKT